VSTFEFLSNYSIIINIQYRTLIELNNNNYYSYYIVVLEIGGGVEQGDGAHLLFVLLFGGISTILLEQYKLMQEIIIIKMWRRFKLLSTYLISPNEFHIFL